MKALVTGASGFVGKVLVRSLLSKNIEVLGIARSKSSWNGKETDQYCCDILDKDQLKSIISKFQPDYIAHLAGPAYIPDTFDKPRKTYGVIFNGTLNVLESIKELNLNTRMLYISSADVYGCNPNERIYETDVFDPINPYASAKACSELLCRQFGNSYDMNVVIARPFNHTGPGQSTDFVCSSFAYQIASMKQRANAELITGNIDVQRDFLDVRDVVEAYYQLLVSGEQGEHYNVASGKSTSLRSIIHTLTNYAGIENCEIIIDPMKIRKVDIPIRVGDNKKIVSLTGWKPQFGIEQTLHNLFDYWKEILHVER